MKFKDVKEGGGKDFIRLKDKESVIGVCAGDLYDFKTHWNGKTSDMCEGHNGCPGCISDATSGKKARFRFRVNFITKVESDYVAKILELGWQSYVLLKELNDEYTLEKHLIKITRKGSGLNDTEYLITPVKNGELDTAKLETISKVPLHDLSSQGDKTQASPEGQPPKFDADEEIPF